MGAAACFDFVAVLCGVVTSGPLVAVWVLLVLMTQSNRVSWVVVFPVLTSQSNRVNLDFFHFIFVFLAMASQGFRLVFSLLYQWNSHYLVWFVQKKISWFFLLGGNINLTAILCILCPFVCGIISTNSSIPLNITNSGRSLGPLYWLNALSCALVVATLRRSASESGPFPSAEM